MPDPSPTAAPEAAAAMAALAQAADVDNPLAATFKDRLAVHLARGIGALGLAARHLARLADRAGAADGLEALLRRPVGLGDVALRRAVARLESADGRGDVDEADVFAAVEAFIRGGDLAEPARAALAVALGEADVERIALLAGYVQAVGASEVGRGGDGRVRAVRAALAAHEELAELLLGSACAPAPEASRPDARMLRLALDGAAQGTWDYDVAADRPSWDGRTFELFGLTPSAPLSYARVLDDYVHPDDRAAVERAARAAMDPAGDGRYAIEHRVRRADGAERWLAVHGRTLFEDTADGRRPVRMLGVVRDVTAEVEDRRRAAASAERLRHALEAAEASAWEWSPHAEPGWWSHENFRLFGLDPDGGVPAFREWLARCVHPDDRARLEADLTAALAGSEDVFALAYRIAHPDRGVRHVTARGRLVRAPSGAVAKLVGLNFDDTERRSIEEALADSREQLDRRLAELEALYAEAPLGLGMLDRELRFVRINAALAEINGFAPKDHLGRGAWELLPDLRDSAEPVFARIFATGEAQRDVPVHGTTPAQPGVEREWREHFYPIKDGGGTVIGIGIVCEEVTAAKRAERQRELLIDELNHRVKNTLAVVHALAHQTFKPGADPEVARLTFAQRLQALGDAHELLTRANWEAASLRALADGVVRRASPEAGRVHLQGPEVTIPPKMAVTLAMTLNELCTNAVKYGALAVGDGEVELGWRQVGEDASRVALSWRETGGPRVAPPASKAFGLTMIEQALAKEFAADVQVDFVPDGLTCRITIPLASPMPASR